MSFEENISKKKLIAQFGQAAGTPLFDSAGSWWLPDWIWNGNDVKAEIFYKMQEKFAADALTYLQALIKIGGSATDHEMKDHFNDVEKWPLHIVSARRNYFKKSGIVECYGKTKMGPKGKPNFIWHVNFRNLYKLINGELKWERS